MASSFSAIGSAPECMTMASHRHEYTHPGPPSAEEGHHRSAVAHCSPGAPRRDRRQGKKDGAQTVRCGDAPESVCTHLRARLKCKRRCQRSQTPGRRIGNCESPNARNAAHTFCLQPVVDPETASINHFLTQ